MSKTQKLILAAVAAERLRQDLLVREGKRPFNCADKNIAGAEKARDLGEEYGEVCKASYELDHPDRAIRTASEDHFFQLLAARKALLREELIQLAAVAVAWAESISVNS